MCVPDRIAIWNCWNENIGDRNALDLKTSLWTSIYGGATPKQPAIMRQTLKDISNKSVLCFSYPDLWQIFISTEAISLRKLGVVHGVVHGPGPWTGSGPRSMFCIRP